MDRSENLALLPLADAEADRLLAAVPEEDRSRCWWIVLQDGSPIAGDKGGGVTLMIELRITRQIGLLLRRLRLSPFVDALDILMARYRGCLSRLVPEGPGPRRYP